MAIVKLTLTEDVLKLVSNIRFREIPNIDDCKNKEYAGFEIDMNNIYGGTFILESIAYILGIYDRHIPGTEDDYDGPKFTDDDTQYMLDLHYFIMDNLDKIEEIIHQSILNDAVTPGTYKCKSWQRIWEKVKD